MTERREELELANATLARIPAGSLGALASLRARPGIRVSQEGAHALVEWESGDRLALERVLPIEGAALFRLEDRTWFAIGSRIPASPQPVLRDAVALASALFPAPFKPEPAPTTPLVRTRLALARDPRPEPTTAVLASLEALGRWAETATTHALRSVRAARSGDKVLLVGPKLPPLGERFWGQRVLRPLGLRTEPALPEAALVRALGLQPEELALVRDSGILVIPGASLEPLGRAAIRAASEPSRPGAPS